MIGGHDVGRAHEVIGCERIEVELGSGAERLHEDALARRALRAIQEQRQRRATGRGNASERIVFIAHLICMEGLRQHVHAQHVARVPARLRACIRGVGAHDVQLEVHVVLSLSERGEA